MKKVLIIGSKGMLGQELVQAFGADKNYETIGWDRDEIDITDEAQVNNKVLKLAPQIIINAAAYNAVDKAEEPAEFELAKKLNGLAPVYLAKAANNLGAIFVHYSSDYVFDGRKETGYLEDDEPSPISNYGISKLMGEQEVARVGGKFYIIRLQKLFGRPAQSALAKKSFFEAMLALAQTKKELEAVDEELANFTFAPDLAERTKWLVENGKINSLISSPPGRGHHSGNKNLLCERSRGLYLYGIYHITNEGHPVTWFDAAKILFMMAKDCYSRSASCHSRPAICGGNPVRGKLGAAPQMRGGFRNEFGMTKYEDIKLIPVPASHFLRPARRPKYSVLLNTKLPPMRPWPEALKEFLANR